MARQALAAGRMHRIAFSTTRDYACNSVLSLSHVCACAAAAVSFVPGSSEQVRTPFSLRPPSAASSPIAPRHARTPTALARSSYALNGREAMNE